MPRAGARTEDDALEGRLRALLARLSLRERVDLLSGRNMSGTVPIPRLGIGSATLTDGPRGVCAGAPAEGLPHGPTTAFASGVAFAASWNPALVARVGAAMGAETLAMGRDVLLGPCVNIHRHPLGGRNFESFSEDPHLAGRIGVGYVHGVQSMGVGACAKHFACNNQERERWRGSSALDDRTLREIYLPAFEAVVREARPWTVMCAYNRVNGVYASQHRLLLSDILRGEWGFDGVVMSDWNATHAIHEPVQAGLDLEMPGPAKCFGRLLYEAAIHWQIEIADIDRAALNILRLLHRCGRLGPRPPPKRGGAVNIPAHQRLARALAGEALVLAKNEPQVLPFAVRRLRSLAVIGPQATGIANGGGSSWVSPPYQVTPLEGLTRLLPKRVRIHHEPGCSDRIDMPVVPSRQLAPPSGRGRGVRVTYFDGLGCGGAPAGQAIEPDISRWTWMQPPHPAVRDWRHWSARYEATYTAESDGPARIQLDAIGEARLWWDGAPLLALAMPDPLGSGPLHQKAHRDLQLARGRRYRVRIDFSRVPGTDDGTLVKFQAGPSPGTGEDQAIARAATRAAGCDAAVVFVGLPDRYESEEGDRPALALPGQQAELVRAVCAANPRTAVVVQCGSPVALPFLDQAPAVLIAWYPGQEGGNAIAEALCGRTNPCGKLPMTFPRRIEDTPAFGHYPGRRVARYGEGIFVGYRHYDARGIEPLLPFGHGLSYTTFAYRGLRAKRAIRRGEELAVAVTVRNTGARPGSEVVQLYLGDDAASLPRPPRELKAFAKVRLSPGEARTVRFLLRERDFSFFDPDHGGWRCEAGGFTIAVGSSSRDLRLRARVRIHA